MYTNSKLCERFAFLNSTILAAFLCSSGLAYAENAENPLTWNGLTVYGTVDIGWSYQSHGRPQNDYFSAGGYTFPNKASTDSSSQFSHNGMGLSVLGLRGIREFADGWSGLFKMETALNPATLKLTDNQKALTQNNGKPITDQTTATDSSLTGPFSTGLYLGVQSKDYGQLTYGRQNTPLKDNFYKYDPLSNSSAFSAFGAFGVPAGGGSTENARLNNALRYQIDSGVVRFDSLYAGSTSSQGGAAWQLGLGSKIGGLSIDGAYAEKKQAVTAASLGIVGTVPSRSAATSVYWLTNDPLQSNINNGYSYASTGSVSVDEALVGTVSDNRAWGLFAKYDFGAPIIFAGFEQITYGRPSSPRSAGFDSIGGYTFAIVNNGAYASNKVFNTMWIGVKYTVLPKLDLFAAAYGYNQNTYTGNVCVIPAATSPGTNIPVNQNNPCSSGSQGSYSLAADYKINSYFDLYVGIMASHLTGGMASGFVHTSVYNAMVGVRTQF